MADGGAFENRNHDISRTELRKEHQSDDADYKRLYFTLFNGMTSALQAMEEMNFGLAKRILMQAQLRAEEAYIDCDETETAEVV